MAFRCSRFVCFVLCLGAFIRLEAQDLPAATKSRLPELLDGLDAAVTFAGVHDSYLGWYTVTTPAISYTFSPHYSADASVSIYPNRLAPDQSATGTSQLIATHGDVGDVFLAAHANYSIRNLLNTSTFSLTFPTGNRVHGLGSGRVTFDISQHIERYFGRTGLILDLGGGDASGLVNSLVTEDFDSLGPLAHFQAGAVVWLHRNAYFQSVAYEQLPIGDQKLYSTIFIPSLGPRTIVTGQRVTEDNGFSSTLAVPLSSHVTLSSTYSRSLRFQLDTVSTGLTFVWKGSRARHEALIDKAIREAEAGTRIPYPDR